jgi:hypothetical protein
LGAQELIRRLQIDVRRAKEPMRLVRAWQAIPLMLLAAGCQAAGEGGETEPPFFVGRWAATTDLCATAAWVFTETGLATSGEVTCTFDTVTRTRTGYDLQATCTAEAPPAPYLIRLAYAQSAQALLVEEGPFDPIGLVACP